MNSPIRIATCLLLAAIVLGASSAQAARGCPFCPSYSLTFAEQVAKADAVVLVQWKSAAPADNQNKTGETVYEITQIARDPLKTLKKGETVSIAGYRAGRPGDLSLLLGSRGMQLDWGPPIDVTETVFNYILQAPSPEAPAEERLTYFLKFLEYPDPQISLDAFGELANAPYKDIVRIASKLPREKLRKWVTQTDLPDGRLGLYGLLLGLCNNPDDVKLLETKIVETSPPQTIRLGIDGVMGGYLLLTGEKGLDYLITTKLDNKDVPFSETYSAMKALEFMWTYGEGRIRPERLKSAMHRVLDRPELADIVIANLSRWKDWSIHERLMSIYSRPEYDIPSNKRAVIQYFLACIRDVPKEKPATDPPHVASAKKRLEELRKLDPKTVRQVERLSGISQPASSG